MLHVELAVAKVAKYAVRESGDSVEVVERPHGGLSVVMADGQRSGRSAKAISNMAVRKAVSLLAEGVRDGAVARAAHDYLRTQRSGQVTAELTIISADLETRTLVISRNSEVPVLVCEGAAWRVLDAPAERVGVPSARAKPVVVELPLAAGIAVIAFSDGMLQAGLRGGNRPEVCALVTGIACPPAEDASFLADRLLAEAVARDAGRPGDDMTVVVMRVVDAPDPETIDVRRMVVSFPVPAV